MARGAGRPARDYEVGGTFSAGSSRLAHRFADRLPAAEHRLVPTDAAILGDLDEQIGVREPDPVPDRRSERGVVLLAADLSHRASLRTPPAAPRRSAARR